MSNYEFIPYSAGSAGGGSGGGSSFITVVQLPTENIDENALYQVVKAKFYGVNGGQVTAMPAPALETATFPEGFVPTSEVFYVLDENAFYAIGYQDGAYVLGGKFDIPVVHDISDIDTSVNGQYGFVTFDLYFYKNGWVKAACTTDGDTQVLKRKFFANLEDALVFAEMVQPVRCIGSGSFTIAPEEAPTNTLEVTPVFSKALSITMEDVYGILLTYPGTNLSTLSAIIGAYFYVDEAVVGTKVQLLSVKGSIAAVSWSKDGTSTKCTADLTNAGPAVLYYYG